MRSQGGRVFVKICGITSVDDARQAVDAGADALGFVFWPKSPRFVTPETAAAIATEVPPFVTRVGVFVEASRDELFRTAERVGLDLLQLPGEVPREAGGPLPRRVLRALRVGPGFRTEDALAWASAGAGLLLDTHRPDSPGGTGVAFDWARVRDLRDRVPFLVLAGGLRADNVAEAIAVVRPHAVDVSSGVESSPGRKDEAKLRAFVEAVHAASREVSLGGAPT